MPRHTGSLVHHKGIRPLGRIVVTHGPRKELHGSTRGRGRVVHHRKPIHHKPQAPRHVLKRKKAILRKRATAKRAGLKRRTTALHRKRRMGRRLVRRK